MTTTTNYLYAIFTMLVVNQFLLLTQQHVTIDHPYHRMESTAGEQYANNSNPDSISSCSLHLLQCNMEEHLAFVDWIEQDTLRVVDHRRHSQATRQFYRDGRGQNIRHVYNLNTSWSPSESCRDHMHGVYRFETFRPPHPVRTF